MNYITLISDVGFPIGAFVLMFYLVDTSLKELRKAVHELTTEIKLLRGLQKK